MYHTLIYLSFQHEYMAINAIVRAYSLVSTERTDRLTNPCTSVLSGYDGIPWTSDFVENLNLFLHIFTCTSRGDHGVDVYEEPMSCVRRYCRPFS